MAMGHVILREFHLDRQAKYFEDYVRQYTDMPMLVRLVKKDGKLVPERLLRASDFTAISAREQSGMEDGRLSTRIGRDRRAAGLGRLPLGRAGQVEPGGEGRQGQRHEAALTLIADTADDDWPTSASPISAIASTTTSSAPIIRACWSARCRCGSGEARRRRDAGRDRVRPVRRQLRRRSRLRRRARRQVLRRQRALHAGLGGEDHRRAARSDHHGRARVRPQRREDQGPSMVIIGAGDEPLVPHGHELPRRSSTCW
jgi:hypothetical protein